MMCQPCSLSTLVECVVKPHKSKNHVLLLFNCENNELILTAFPRSELTFTTSFSPKPQSLLCQILNPCYSTLHSYLLSEISLLVWSNTFHSTVIYFWFACFLGHEDLRPAHCIHQSGNMISGTLGRPDVLNCLWPKDWCIFHSLSWNCVLQVCQRKVAS